MFGTEGASAPGRKRPHGSFKRDLIDCLLDLVDDDIRRARCPVFLEPLHRRDHPDHEQRDEQDKAEYSTVPCPASPPASRRIARRPALSEVVGPSRERVPVADERVDPSVPPFSLTTDAGRRGRAEQDLGVPTLRRKRNVSVTPSAGPYVDAGRPPKARAASRTAVAVAAAAAAPPPHAPSDQPRRRRAPTKRASTMLSRCRRLRPLPEADRQLAEEAGQGAGDIGRRDAVGAEPVEQRAPAASIVRAKAAEEAPPPRPCPSARSLAGQPARTAHPTGRPRQPAVIHPGHSSPDGGARHGSPAPPGRRRRRRRRSPARAAPERSSASVKPRPAAAPSSTTLPVMLAEKAPPRPRKLIASTGRRPVPAGSTIVPRRSAACSLARACTPRSLSPAVPESGREKAYRAVAACGRRGGRGRRGRGARCSGRCARSGASP